MTEDQAEIICPQPPAKSLIVGSRGRMGAMLLERAQNAALDVAGIDLPLADLEKACAKKDMVLLCVPARSFEEVVCRVTPFMARDTILADITSVKEGPMRQMEKYWQGPVVGTHPLFGPATPPESGLSVALMGGQHAAQASIDSVAAFFRKLGCVTFETRAETHDMAMAKIQNMNFITNLAYFAALAGQKELLPFLTPSFERRRQAAAKMLNEDAEMFAGLFEANGHSQEAVRQYRRMLNLAASGDIDLLAKRARWWWENGVEQ